MRQAQEFFRRRVNINGGNGLGATVVNQALWCLQGLFNEVARAGQGFGGGAHVIEG